jgi:hypothetical protein
MAKALGGSLRAFLPGLSSGLLPRRYVQIQMTHDKNQSSTGTARVLPPPTPVLI